MPSIYPCPKCGEYHYHKSHTKSIYEKLRKNFLKDRVFRCHKCGHRGWIRIRKLKLQNNRKMIYIYILVLFAASVFGMMLKSVLR